MPGEFGKAPGYNQVANNYFTPEIWSLRMLKNYYETAIAPDIVNMDYEGEIKNAGDKVNIRRDPEVEIYPYRKGMKLNQQTVVDAEEELLIDQGIYFNFPVDDVERRQSDVPWVNKVTNNAAIKTKNYIDKLIFETVYSDVGADNTIADQTLTAATADSLIIDAGVLLDEANAPDDGRRWIVITHWAKGMFQLNPTFVDASAMGDKVSMIRNGIIGTMNRFRVYSTSNLYTTGGYTYALFGHPDCITFATQITQTETLRNQDSFGDIIRGLQVFGFKTVQSSILGMAGIKA